MASTTSFRDCVRQRPLYCVYVFIALLAAVPPFLCQSEKSLSQVVQAQSDCQQVPRVETTYRTWLKQVGKPAPAVLDRVAFDAWCDEAERILNVYEDINSKYKPAGFSYLSDTPVAKRITGYATDPTYSRARRRSSNRRRAQSGGACTKATVDWTQAVADAGLLSRPLQIRDQGTDCQSCWAMSATSSLELGNFANNGWYTRLSVMQVTQCASSTKFCNPDDYRHALSYAQTTGVIPESVNPYSVAIAGRGADGSPFFTNSQCPIQTITSIVESRKYYGDGFEYVSLDLVASDSELFEAVCRGPVVTAMDATTLDSVYTTGIFEGNSCGEDASSRTHAVLIVGYGRDPDFGDYWLIQNSRGSGWGEGGLFRVPRGEDLNTCGIKLDPVYPLIKSLQNPGPTPSPSPPPPPPKRDCVTYTVKSGDTCFKIWSDFGLDIGTFFSYNPNLNCRTLQPDQVICISASSSATSSPTPPPSPSPTVSQTPTPSPSSKNCGQTYTTIENDTCFTLQSRFNLKIGDLLALNPGLNCRLLSAGKELCIAAASSSASPPPPPASTCGQSYTTIQGDTCWTIQSTFGLTLMELLALNSGLNCRLLVGGKDICIAGPTRRSLQSTTSTNSNTTEATDVCIGSAEWQAGDTFLTFATRYNTTIDNLAKLNLGLLLIQPTVGQRICYKGGVLPNRPCSQYHIVQRGDSCYTICTKYQVPLVKLNAYNTNPINCDKLLVNQSICVLGTETRRATLTYVILPGDTCESIANKSLVPVRDLLSLNSGLNCSNLPVGTQITTRVFFGSASSKMKPLVNCFRNETVRAGDTCESIIQRLRLTNITNLNPIEALNPNVGCGTDSKNLLRLGMIICVAGTFTQPPTQTLPAAASTTQAFDTKLCKTTYVVQRGDYCTKIAANNGLSIDRFRTLNPRLISCGSLRAGTAVCVKGKVA